MFSNAVTKLARIMGVVEMETKPCIVCGKPVSLSDAIAAYLEYKTMDGYVADYNDIVFNDDNDIDSNWWMHTLIPMRNEYADVYAMHPECVCDWMGDGLP